MCLNGPCREGEEPTPAMYGGEKSDRAIVAMKPVNKAERSAAESVERRARAEGSAVQRYTRVGRSAGVGAPIAGLLRVVDPPLPKVGAVCGKAARTVLCGGRSAMSVPTAIAPSRCNAYEAGTRRIPTIPSTDRRGATRRTVDASKVWPMRAGHCRLHRGIFAMVPDSVVSLTRSDSWSF